MIGNEKEPFNVVKTSTMHFYVDPLIAPALASFPWNRSKLMLVAQCFASYYITNITYRTRVRVFDQHM